MTTVKVPTKAWFGDEEFELTFRDAWDVTVWHMKGHDAPAMTDDAIRKALASPIGTPPLRELAEQARRAVIVFDDLSRPTPAHRIVPFLLEELHQGGISDDEISFVAALGAHHTMMWHELAKKLGPEIVENYRVYNHNMFHHLVDVGSTSRGTPVLVNREVMAADLRIGLGGMIPHHGAGFGGGSKIVVPGIVGYETIYHNHLVVGERRGFKGHPSLGLNKVQGNIMREDNEEAARMVGIHFKVDVLVNARREAVDLVAGDIFEAWREGVRRGRQHYATEAATDMDIVVTNTYPIENEPVKADWPAKASVRGGGDVVYIWRTEEGWIPHYLVGRFGRDYGGEMWAAQENLRVPNAARILALMPTPSRTDMEWLGPAEKVRVFKEWGSLRADLEAKHGNKARVAVYPCSSIQCPPVDDGF